MSGLQGKEKKKNFWFPSRPYGCIKSQFWVQSQKKKIFVLLRNFIFPTRFSNIRKVDPDLDFKGQLLTVNSNFTCNLIFRVKCVKYRIADDVPKSFIFILILKSIKSYIKYYKFGLQKIYTLGIFFRDLFKFLTGFASSIVNISRINI